MEECVNALLAAMAAEVAKRGQTLAADAPTLEHIRKCAEWLTGAADRPGLLLRGDVGNGKTTLMRAVCLLIAFVTEETEGYSGRRTVPVWTARRMALLCGDEAGRREYRRLCELPMLAIDDLGEEPTEVISYGMVYEPVKDILLERYSRQLFTMVTTNLTGRQLREKYSGRVYDRLREMMTIVNFTNPSYRC